MTGLYFKVMLRFLVLGFVFSLVLADSKEPLELPRFSSFETGVLAAEKYQSKKVEGSESQKPDGISCEQKIVTELEQYLDNLGVQFRNNVSDVFGDSKVFNKVCK